MEKYQTIGPRFLALIIDSLLAIPVSILIMGLAGFTDSNKIELLSSSLINMVAVFYYILMHFHYGQTLGKMAMKVKVLDISENPINFTQAVIRSLPQLLPVFISASILSRQMLSQNDAAFTNDFLEMAVSAAYILYFIWEIGDIISGLITEKKRALHDFIAGTVVVRTDGWSNLSINSK